MNLQLFYESVGETIETFGNDMYPDYILNEDKLEEIHQFCKKAEWLMEHANCEGFELEIMDRRHGLVIALHTSYVAFGNGAHPLDEGNEIDRFCALAEMADAFSFDTVEEGETISIAFAFFDLWKEADANG